MIENLHLTPIYHILRWVSKKHPALQTRPVEMTRRCIKN